MSINLTEDLMMIKSDKNHFWRTCTGVFIVIYINIYY